MNYEETYITIENKKEDDIENTLFFDTYALYKIYEGDNNYSKYSEYKIVITKLNLFEIYLAILRDHGEEDADKLFNSYYNLVRDFDENVIKQAAKLKNRLNKRNISMTDCIGYIFAKQLGIKFLTGDKEFENLDNVEFVK